MERAKPTSPKFIDYVLIQHDDNPEYTFWLGKIWNRFNRFGIKVIDYEINPKKSFEGFKIEEDITGIPYYRIKSGVPDYPMKDPTIRRDYDNFFLRYLVCGLPQFATKTILLGEADFMPININAILNPRYDICVEEVVNEDKILSYYKYEDTGIHQASWTIARGSLLNQIGTGCKRGCTDAFEQLSKVREWQFKVGQMYKIDEEFTAYNIKKWHYKEVNLGISGRIEDTDIMRPHQIQYLNSCYDLAQFSDLHAIKKSYMTSEDWNKLEELLLSFDDCNICAKHYYEPTMDY